MNYDINLLYHAYLPDSVAARIVTLIESKCAIYRGLGRNIFWHISSNAHNEYLYLFLSVTEMSQGCFKSILFVV